MGSVVVVGAEIGRGGIKEGLVPVKVFVVFICGISWGEKKLLGYSFVLGTEVIFIEEKIFVILTKRFD